MKTNIITINTIMKQYIKYLCAVVMALCLSVNAWGTAPGANYTLVTSASTLHNGDAVILYDDVNNVGVTGTSGTSATYSSSSDDWIEYTVTKPTGSTVTLADWSFYSAPEIYADEDGNLYKFTYSSSGTSFSINSSGNLVYSSTRLGHYGNYIRFYATAGTPLKVYQVGSPKVYEETCEGDLCINPNVINIGGEYDGVNVAELESDLFFVKTNYSYKSHYVYVEWNNDNLELSVYDYDYDEPFGTNGSGYYTTGAGEDMSRLKIVCLASAAGSYSATLHAYAYNYDGAGNHKHMTVPINITVLEKEQECTPRTLNFEHGTDAKTIYKATTTTYTNAATPSAGDGYGTVTYAVTSSSPSGCATVNGSGVVSFSNYGSATITASLGANGAYCATPDVNYTVSMECSSRTLDFASSTPSVSVTTDTYTQTATKSAGNGTISYSMVQSVGSGFTINSETGEVSFNDNAGTATITASITADATGGYCTAEGSYTLTVTPVIPTVSNFTALSTESSMTLNGSAVTDNGGTAITSYGYIYSTTANTAGTLVVGGSGVTTAQVAASNIAVGTAFTEKSITSLTSGTTYYVRAYATNSAGTGYSDIQPIKTVLYSNYQFSCSELTLTAKPATDGTPFFITSSAGKKVRSQDSILIVGSGLTPGQALEFPNLDSKFTVRSRTDGALSVGADGTINAVAYIFYTPGADETTDGLQKITGITVKVGGAKPKQVTLTQDIIGRHLPANFVIAAKDANTQKWYALPDSMRSTGNPLPVEIAVDDFNNPTIAYTANTNYYALYENSVKQYVQFGMTNNPNLANAGLWANDAKQSTNIGKNGNAVASNNLGDNYQWLLTQTNTSITNPQDAKYTISNPNNSNPLKLWMAAGGVGNPKWGLYASGISELRLIPASDIPYTEASFVEWGQHGGIVEVDAGPTGIDANTVVATLNGTTRTASSFSQTLTSVKGSATKYNYTVNFGDDIDFAAAASNGAMLTLEWKNGDATKAMSNIIVPKIIATDGVMKSIMSGDTEWETEVHVLPGVTLEANAGDFLSKDVTINQLEIYPGATVKVTKGAQDAGTLKVKTLVLRNGWTRVGKKAFDVARLYVTPTTASLAKSANTDVWYVDWYIDYDQYYSIAVPFPVATNAITYKNTRSAASSGVIIRWYDGQQRASTGQEQIGKNWKAYTWGSDMPTNLNPSRGYAMTAKRPTGKAFSIVRMPLTYSSNKWTEGGEQGYINVDATTYRKDTVTVTGWASPEWYAMGWNFVANPYMSLFNDPDENGINGSLVDQEGKGIRYATIPDVDFKNYEQVNIREASLKPCSGFFVQDNNPESETLTFSNSHITPPSVPARFMKQDEALPEQEAYIQLSHEGGKDQMGLIIADEYTAEYEVNADLAKILGEGNFVKTYMHYADMDMAYVAINATLAKNWIPVTVNIPQTGEYTFSLTNASIVDELDGVYLIDYGNGNKITNLIERDYVFTAAEGTLTDRFAINAIYGERETPTAIDAVEGGLIDGDKPIKFLFHEKVFILYQGIIYDATGKRVNK